MSPELTRWEKWVLDVYFRERGFLVPHNLSEVRHRLTMMSFDQADEVLASLMKKKVLALSPDQTKVRVTDYGAELYSSLHMAQEEWETQPIVRVSTLDRDQVVIRAGEVFRGNRMIREVLDHATRDRCIIDPYVGVRLFDLLQDSTSQVTTRIITSQRVSRSTVAAYEAFRVEYQTCEMRVMQEEKLHDRYILWDGARGIHLGHSIKDVGKKDTQISWLNSAIVQIRLFEERWTEAQPA